MITMAMPSCGENLEGQVEGDRMVMEPGVATAAVPGAEENEGRSERFAGADSERVLHPTDAGELMGERSFRDCPVLLIEESQDSDAATSKLEATLWCGLVRENCTEVGANEDIRRCCTWRVLVQVASGDCWNTHADMHDACAQRTK